MNRNFQREWNKWNDLNIQSFRDGNYGKMYQAITGTE